MKPQKLILFLAVSLSCLPIGSCELLSDKDTDKECDENKLTSVFDRYIEVSYIVGRGTNMPAPGHDVLNAQVLTFSGSVRKMDCHDQEASYFKIDSSFEPSQMTLGQQEFKFPLKPAGLSRSFFFHFHNGLEYVSTSFIMYVQFADGSVYKSKETYSNTNRIKYWTQGDIATYTMNMNETVTWEKVN